MHSTGLRTRRTYAVHHDPAHGLAADCIIASAGNRLIMVGQVDEAGLLRSNADLGVELQRVLPAPVLAGAGNQAGEGLEFIERVDLVGESRSLLSVSTWLVGTDSARWLRQ